MTNDPDPFMFPDMPDEAVVAIDQFLEAFYHRFQNHYFAQMHRWHHALDHPRALRRPHAVAAAPRSTVLKTRNDRGADAAVTIADGPSPIVNTSPSN